jgi:hypothetical protein
VYESAVLKSNEMISFLQPSTGAIMVHWAFDFILNKVNAAIKKR